MEIRLSEIIGYKNPYYISSNGQFFSYINNKLKLLNGGKDKDGYNLAYMSKKDGKRVKRRIARLVGFHFCEVPYEAIENPEDYEADHIDRDIDNDDFTNIQIITKEKNLSRRQW